jgi:hypothetical protein
MHNHNVYEVVFDNGDVVKADAEHLWNVNSTNWTAGSRNLTTEQLIPYLSHSNKPYIEFTKPLDLQEQQLPIDPYLLGVWLGDGSSKGATITCHKDDLNVYKEFIKVGNVWTDSRNDNVVYFTAPCGQTALKQMNLYGNKHIPTSYLLGSFEQRLNLLRGLMDTDGSTSKQGSCEFYQKNEELIDQVRTLLSTLGIKSRKRYRLINGIRYWTVSFNTSLVVFNLPRKKSLQQCKNHKKNNRIYITRIRKIDTVPVRCLQVDNADHLFLCGTTLVPTHNTTTIAGMILHYVLFNENYNVAILAHKLQQAREILSRIQLAYEHLPKWLQQGIVEWNKGNIELENGSKILASATSSSAIRGGSYNLIYLDEFAFVSNNLQEVFFASVYPTISSGNTSKVLITSTPNGLNMFYKIWIDSEEGRNSYKRIDVHWSDVPGRDERWKLETIRNTSEEQFRQEFECEFIGSSNTLINGSKLRTLVIKSPVKTSPNIKFYADPRPNRVYVMTVDTARGVGGDYSAFVVFDITEIPYRTCCVYRNNLISPLLYPNIIRSIATAYNSATVLVESNDIGQQVADILHYELEYEGVLVTTNKGRSGQAISGGFSRTAHYGVRTTKSIKKIGCANLKTLIESDKLIVEDYDMIYELSRFILNGTSYEAEDGNDDTVMCLVMFGWLIQQPYIREMSNTDVRRNLLDENMRILEEEALPIGFIDNGIPQDPNEVVTLHQDSFEKWMRE